MQRGEVGLADFWMSGVVVAVAGNATVSVVLGVLLTGVHSHHTRSVTWTVVVVGCYLLSVAVALAAVLHEHWRRFGLGAMSGLFVLLPVLLYLYVFLVVAPT